MRNMSFMLTTNQVLQRKKTVTRRLGWWKLKPGDLLKAVEKGMGLKKGEKVKPLTTIRIISVRPEPLCEMTNNTDYGFDECVAEGFGDHTSLRWPSEFVRFFCDSHAHCNPNTVVNRIEFEYVDS